MKVTQEQKKIMEQMALDKKQILCFRNFNVLACELMMDEIIEVIERYECTPKEIDYIVNVFEERIMSLKLKKG